MGHKAAGTTHSSNNAFGPGAANELTVLWWFKKFCKGDKSLEDEQHSAGHPKLTMTKLRAITEADPLTATLEVAKELNVTRSVTVFWCLEQTERWKTPMSRRLVSWLQTRGVIVLRVFSYSLQRHQTISCGFWCTVISGFCTTTSDDWLSDWTEMKLWSASQSQTCTQKRSWSLFGGLLPTSPLQLSESQRNHYIWEACSASRWDTLKTARPAAGTGRHKGPNSFPQERPTTHGTPSTSKIEQIGLGSFASSAIFTWPLTNWLPL